MKNRLHSLHAINLAQSDITRIQCSYLPSLRISNVMYNEIIADTKNSAHFCGWSAIAFYSSNTQEIHLHFKRSQLEWYFMLSSEWRPIHTSNTIGTPKRNSSIHMEAVKRILFLLRRCGYSSIKAVVIVSNIPN